MKKLIALISALLIISLFPALPAGAAAAYEITSYEVKVVVNSDRSCDFTEIINVYFHEPRHGIYRTVPISSESRIYNIVVQGDEYDFFTEYNPATKADFAVLQIGDPGVEIQGAKQYTIKYTLSTPEIENNPGLCYLNLIGTDWDAPIRNAKIEISFPAQTEDVMFHVGRYGAAGGGDRLLVENLGQSLIISTKDSLNPREGITVEALLPSGAFTSRKPTYELMLFAIALAGLAIIILLFILFGRDKKLTLVVDFKPPKNINPAEAGYLINQYIGKADISALIFYWASHGHLHIKELPRNDYELIRISPLDEWHTRYEKEAFEALFEAGEDDKVKVSQLKGNYYKTVQKIKSNILISYTGDKTLVEKKYAFVAGYVAALIFPLLGFLRYWRVQPYTLAGIPFGLFCEFFGVILMAYMWYISINIFKLSRIKLMVHSALFTLLGVAFTLIYAGSGPDAALSFNFMLLPAAAAVLSAAIVPYVTRRTGYYNSMLERLLGFREFILTVKKEQLETMIKDNPTYYYDVLPYAQALGVSDIWSDKFADIHVQPPDWYYGINPYFNLWLFSSSINTMGETLSRNAFTPPQSTGTTGFGGGGFGGGGFGGGFSGGGFGGGGGGSW